MANNCGCNSNPGSSDNCYPNNNTVAQITYPISYNDCYGNSGGPSNCPVNYVNSVPTTEAGYTVPAVGATFNLSLICKASEFRIGQWIQIGSMGGKYPIVGVNAVTNVLTLRNSCSDGVTAISGNPDPGTQFSGTQSIWLTGSDPCLDQLAFCTGVRECLQGIDEDNPLCLENIPLTTPAQGVYILGLTAACDAGDCPQPDDPNCITKLDGVRFYEDTICFSEGLAAAEEGETVRSVGITEDGCLRQSGGGAFFPLRVRINQWGTAGNAAAISAAVNQSADLEDFGVPTGATAAAIRMFYSFQSDTGEDEGLFFSTYLRGASESVNSTNTGIISNYNAINVGTADNMANSAYATVPLTPSDKTIYHEWQDLGTDGNTNSLFVTLWLDGYYL